MISRADVIARSGVLAVVRCPDDATIGAMRGGQLLLGLLGPLDHPQRMAALATKGVVAVAFDLLPRTLSRAQSMDALTSQSTAAGYGAAVVAAEASGRFFPMMITAAGTARPASVIVIGAGVAGLEALSTARRLGAVVTGYDVRPASRGEVESVGATFLTSTVAQGAGEGGYARVMTADELRQQQAELAGHLTRFDVIITTAKVPGRTPPELVSVDTLSRLTPGSVCVDLAAGDHGGNVAGALDGKRIITPGGVTIIGGDLAADLPTSASQMYARNVLALLGTLIIDDTIRIDPADEVHAAVVVCRGGELTSAAVRAAQGLPPAIPIDASKKAGVA
ncbi:NADP-transhydrogenase [Leifsonia xyli subsp. cynodontis DSM 46306]|uniref:proton-translocating NAD(P)(+) transhydrogenase n=1 Tax=Leifsonia xyli subsp. cynodontis DSM 46306 TaxID=1389489 RepID=U3P6K3_LEIXC|nr:NADP-transhydrogenase [Leifsonia xyli subsp. cynodontis DSM 46306]